MLGSNSIYFVYTLCLVRRNSNLLQSSFKVAVPHERGDLSILLGTHKYSLYAATISKVFDTSSAEKLNLELYVAFFKFKIHVTPDTGQMQIFG